VLEPRRRAGTQIQSGLYKSLLDLGQVWAGLDEINLWAEQIEANCDRTLTHFSTFEITPLPPALFFVTKIPFVDYYIGNLCNALVLLSSYEKILVTIYIIYL
jgi:hypothetical protein